MGRKMKLDGNCGSKFITIDDEKKWALIREIATVDRYKNSFNAIVNDALMFGLPRHGKHRDAQRPRFFLGQPAVTVRYYCDFFHKFSV